MKVTKKIVSSLLAILLVVTLLPTNLLTEAYADGGSNNRTVILAGSDFQAVSDGVNTSDELSASNVNGILTRIKQDYATADGFIFCGDLDASDKKEDVVTGRSQVHAAVAGVYDGLDEYYVQGNHDNAKVMQSGLYEEDDYSVFIINYDDCNWRDSYNTTLFQQLRTFLDTKAREEYAKPIFVTGHTPLHYSTRDDVKHAKVIFDILNEAGANGLNIIYLFGHNHSGNYDSYLGSGAIYLPVGSEICVQDGKSNYTRQTLNFTYMNAGYVGKVADGNLADKTLTMSVFEIENDRVTVKRYDENGEHVLKAAGVALTNDFDGCVADTSIVPSGQILQAQYGTMLIDEPTGVKAKTVHGTALTVTPVTNLTTATLQAANSNGQYSCYDISVTGYTDGERITVYLPVGELAAPMSVYYLGDEGPERMPMQIVGDYAVFTTYHLSRYMLTTVDVNDGMNWVPVSGEGTYTYTRVSTSDRALDGRSFVIARDSVTKAMVISDGGFVPQTITKTNFTMNTNANELVFEEIAANTYRIHRADQYLHNNNGTLELTAAPGQFDDSYTWSDTDSGSHYFKNGTSGADYLCIEDSAVTVGDKHSVDLYELTSSQSDSGEGGLAALDAEDEINIWAGVFPTGTSLLADVKARIHVYYKDDALSTNIEDVTSQATLVGTVDPLHAGDYTVAVQYKGQTLGNITIHVVERSVTSVALIAGQTSGEVVQYSGADTKTGDQLHVVYSDGSEENVDITVGMLSGGGFDINVAGTYNNLTVTYGGQSVSGYKLTVKSVEDVWVEIPDRDGDGGEEGGGSGGEEGGEGTTYTFELDTDGISDGEYGVPYLIVAWNSVAVLHGTNTEKDVTISDNKIIAPITWACSFTKLEDGTASISQNGKYIEHGTSGNIVLGATPDAWTLDSKGAGKYKIKDGSYSVGYGSTFSYQTGSGNGAYVRLFKCTDPNAIPGSGTGGDTPATVSTYAHLSGNRAYSFSTNQFADRAALETYLRGQITVQTSTDPNGANPAVTDDYSFSGIVNPKADGTYTLTVMYKGTALGNISVSFASPAVESIEVAPMSGTISRGASRAKTGSTITVHYTDGSSSTVKLTANMLNGENLDIKTVGTYENLTVTYGGKSVIGYTLAVVAKDGEIDYPEYPNGGSVRVGKTGEGIDFTSTGIAQIELSAAGIPVDKGIDVVVMLDTSGSMAGQKIEQLRHAVSEMLTVFQQPNENGSESDIRVAIADFNGYIEANGKPTLDPNDLIGSSSFPKDKNLGQIFTGDGSIGVGAFDNVNDIDNDDLVSQIIDKNGTNYDYAFDTIYRLGTAIKADNAANGQERDLYVLFMSDGFPHQFNYYYSGSNHTEWNNWLLGTMDPAPEAGDHPYFYNSNDSGRHWMAEAIKGSPDNNYLVIDPTKSLGDDATAERGDYFRSVPGLGAIMYSIGFDLKAEGQIKVDTISHVIRDAASVENGKQMFYNAANETELDEAFTQIAGNIKMAATNARFVDTMGKDYDIQLKTVNYTLKGSDENKTIAPVIEVKSYDIYKTSQIGKTVNGHEVTAADVGMRYGDAEVLEKVTFNGNGTEAYSGSSTNILVDGVIQAKTFWYNTNEETVNIDTDGDDVADYELAPETFYWKIGTINEKELALSYYVYLTGSMEGARPEGSYPTNESATLYYTNWLDHEAHLDTITPVLPWGSAIVRYAFYLVNDDGDIVVNRGTGATGSFKNKIAVTQPVVGAAINLNSGAEINAEIVATDVLPSEYQLYDTGAQYTVGINSNGTGNWGITKGTEKATTYVTDYRGAEFSRDLSVTDDAYDYTHTTVWFAVKYTIKCVPDVVVVDFGLPVDIDVIANDMFGDYGKLTKVCNVSDVDDMSEDGYSPRHDTSVATVCTPEYGTVTVENGKITYSPMSMQMYDVETFAYEVQYANPNSENSGYYYGTVSVVPATMMHYEDGYNAAQFVTFDGDWSATAATSDSDYDQSKKQAQDRPGFYSMSAIDANNIYGYDQAYDDSITYGLFNARKVTVNKNTYTTDGKWPTAQFTFTGTGFDLISLTSKNTGFITVDVYKTGEVQKGIDGKLTIVPVAQTETPDYCWAVDTYYGYDRVDVEGYIKYTWTYTGGKWDITTAEVEEAGENTNAPESPEEGDTFVTYEKNYNWHVTEDSNNALYQIPVIKSEKLAYGQYTVVVTPMYSSFFQHVPGNNSYDFYFDSVRIYDPADTSDSALNAYKKDNEAYPQYIEIRNELIAQEAFSSDESVNGAVFIDAFGVEGDIDDYAAYGPNNEVYLKPNQSIAFTIKANDASNIASVQLGAKGVNGKTGFEIHNIDAEGNSIAKVTKSLNTATDMFYNISDVVKWNGNTSKVIVITNNSDNILSLTNIKITYTDDPAVADNVYAPAPARLMMSNAAMRLAVNYLETSYVEEHTYYAAPPTPTDPVDPVEPVEPVDPIDPTEPSVFTPVKFLVTLDNTSVKVGKSVNVQITTSPDVKSVMINGEYVQGKVDNKTGDMTYSYVVHTDSVGVIKVSAAAYDGNGVASEPVVNTITVTAHDHNYDSGKVTKAATCTAAGEKIFSCTVCGATKTEAIPAKEHTVVTDKAASATCTKAGKTEGSHCSICGAVIKKQTAVAAKSHSYVDTVKKATYTAKGYTLHKCSACGDSYKDSYTAMKKLSQTKITSVANTKDGITIKWNKVTGATAYQVYRKVGTGSWKLIKTTTSTSLTNTKLTNGNKYQYKVRAIAKNSAGKIVNKGAYSAIKTMYRLTRPTLASGTKNIATKKIVVKWNKNTKATGYQIKYVKGSTVKTVKVKGASDLSKTLSKLTKGSTYKVYVRSYKTVSGTTYYSAYSAVKSVKVVK